MCLKPHSLFCFIARHGLRARRRQSLAWALLALVCALPTLSRAVEVQGTQQPEAGPADPAALAREKRQFHLFNPTPEKLMRELTTDRPDKTESPITVDAGHFQLEMDLANFTLDRADGVKTRTWNVAPINLKVGLLQNVDLQIVWDSYVNQHVSDRGAGTRVRTSGVGDLTARLKINLWGNEGGQTAFGLLPFVKFPTSSGGLGNNGVEGGLILPLAVSLPGGWGVGVMGEYDFTRDEEGRGYHAELIHSITIGHDIVGKLAGYVEFFSQVSTERGSDWIGTVDVGLTLGLTDNLQIDAGCNIGVTRGADDVQPFAGLSVRF